MPHIYLSQISVQQKKKKKKNYFNNNECKDLILIYQQLYNPLLLKTKAIWDSLAEEMKDRLKKEGLKEKEWIRVETDKNLTPEIIALRADIIKRLIPVIRGEINTIGFYKFAALDDIIQEAVIACQNSLPLFDETKVTPSKKDRSVFNYFSITTKKKLRGYTKKQSNIKRKEVQSKSFTAYLASYEVYQENPSTEFFKYFEEFFEGKDRYLELLRKLKEFCLEINKSMDFKKKEFRDFAEAWGFSQGYTDKFINIIRSQSQTFWRKHHDL